jgi:Papain-like cysteine protease AvrRpt2
VAKYSITIEIDDSGGVTVQPQPQPQSAAAASVYAQPANGALGKRLGSSFSSAPGGGNGTPPHSGGGDGDPHSGGGDGDPHSGGGNGTPVQGGGASVFSIQTQQQKEWCWAAVAVSIDKYFNPASTWTQCQVASNVTGSRCCGPAPAAGVDPCDQAEKLQDALTVVSRLRSTYGRALQFPAVKREIDSGRPVAARIQWTTGDPGEGQGHFVVVDGYRILPGAVHLHVSDPLNPSCWVDFDEFTNNYQGDGEWNASFLVEGP